MIRTPHPDLRRLYALGSVAARTADRLGGVLPDLSRLLATPTESTLIDDAALQALVRAPNITALFEDGTERTADEDSQQTAQHAGDGVVPLPVRGEQRQSTPQQASIARSVAKSSRTDALPQRAHLDSAPAPATTAQRRESQGGEVASPGTSRGRSATSLERSRRRSSTSATASHQDGGEGRVAGADVAAGTPHTMRKAVQQKMSARRLEAKQRIEDIRRELLVEDSATDALRRRAIRVGAPAAADTPMLVSAPSAQVGALLEQIVASNAPADAGTSRNGAVKSLAIPIESSRGSNASVSLPALTRVLDRIPQRALSSGQGKMGARAASQSAAAQRAGAQRAASALRGAGNGRARSGHNAPDDNVGDFAGAPGEEPTSGLRRLLALHGGAPQSASPTAHTRELPPTPMSGVVASRLRDAELAEALDRLLRREARRQGVDLEGLSG